MMQNNQDLILYLEAIDTIRKEKGLSIEALIEDITSERSYRRYMNQELSIPLQTLEKMILRLGVSMSDILIYVLKVKQKPSGIIEFFTYLHYDEFILAKPFYERLKNYQKDSLQLNTLVSMYVSWYEYKSLLISSDTFKTTLESHKHIFNPAMNTIESLSFYILYAITFEDFTLHETIMRSLLENNFYLSQILLFDIITDQYLLLLSKDDIYEKDYERLSTLFYQVAHMWHDAYFIYSAYVHQAYLKFRNNDLTYKDDLKKHLYYEHLLLSKPSKKYENMISVMTSSSADLILKKDLEEALK
jgi:transcriptional regulator with XRE-family HTH domain